MSTSIVRQAGETSLDRAVLRGISTGILDADVLAKFRVDVPKGILQIASVVGSPHLRDDIEKGFSILRGLASLGLDHLAHGDSDVAARLLRDKGILAMSRTGNSLLRDIYSLPESISINFINLPFGGRFIERWANRGYNEITAELVRRNDNKVVLDAADWLLRYAGWNNDSDDLAVIEQFVNTALLSISTKQAWPESVADLKRILKKSGSLKLILMPGDCPAEFCKHIRNWVSTCQNSVLPVLQKKEHPECWTNESDKINPLAYLVHIPFIDGQDIELRESQLSRKWVSLVGSKSSEHGYITILLYVSLGISPKKSFTKADLYIAHAAILSESLDDTAVLYFIDTQVPYPEQEFIRELWVGFLEEVTYAASEGGESLLRFLTNEVKHNFRTSKAK